MLTVKQEKVRVFSQKLQVSRTVIDLDASDDEEMAAVVDVMEQAEDAEGLYMGDVSAMDVDANLVDDDFAADEEATAAMYDF